MNKYKMVSILLFSFSLILLVIMAVNIVMEYHNYYQHPLENSAPFSVAYLINGVIFGAPAIVTFALAFLFKNKSSKQ
ncbi:hypothetical protein [Neobacillus sp. PS3-40]|uniref:hypothetical protein n=1 Tax=Neobacillus sp. PS3-40 TaxID=3070679 RepID=UPI0027E1551D|nr:hypothetical protein [Neobacillus sp. PS3-40]WML45453.1 hypothetical protein RCG20_06000 [Neobacillus sp. PS3-40]